MKLEEDLKSVRYIRECVDLVVNEEGYVILPAWQFVLLVKEYENYRQSIIMWAALVLLLAVFLILMPALVK